tara:strand:- start:488 stop:946 length:459 start_codon:yes stop_codon:yes gene_type:complete
MAGEYKISQLETALAALIIELDAAAYQQGRAPAAWSESKVALSPASVAHALGHLCFAVTVESAPVSASRSAPPSCKLTSEVAVRFTYHLRPTMQIADARSAADAAGDIAAACVALSQYYSTRLVNAYEPELSSDGEWMLVTVTFLATHTIAL